VKSISECVLNVLRGNLQLTACQKRLRALADNRVPISTKKRLINHKGVFLVALLSAILPTKASHILFARRLKMLRKMYLVTPNYLNKNERPSQSHTKELKSPLQKTTQSTKHKTRVTRKKWPKHPNDNWVAMRGEIEEAAVGRRALRRSPTL